MGNCSQKGVSGECTNSMIRILTVSGTIIQFKGPKLVKDVLVDYSGHGIFRQLGDDPDTSMPLSDYEYLLAGQCYYLLPLRDAGSSKNKDLESTNVNDHQAAPCNASSEELPDSSMENLALGPDFQVLPTSKNGVWRVKLVINTKQLGQILSEEENTEALIEKMRVAATATNPARSSRRSWGSAWKIRPGLSNAFKASSAESC